VHIDDFNDDDNIFDTELASYVKLITFGCSSESRWGMF